MTEDQNTVYKFIVSECNKEYGYEWCSLQYLKAAMSHHKDKVETLCEELTNIGLIVTELNATHHKIYRPAEPQEIVCKRLLNHNKPSTK